MLNHRGLLRMFVWLSGAVLMAHAFGADAVQEPRYSPQRQNLRLQEVWRVGGDDDDDGVLLGQIGAAVSGLDGEVYALDSQLAQVLVFGADGRLLRVLGREGEGPGEFRRPTGLFLTPGGAVVVMQTFPGRLIFLDSQTGESCGQWTVGRDDPQAGGFGMLLGARDRGSARAVAVGLSSFDMAAGSMRTTQYLALLDTEGRELQRLAEQTLSRDLARQTRDDLADHFTGQRGLWDIDPEGHLYLVPFYDQYVIEIFGPDGKLLREISQDHTARMRTDEEKEQQRASMNMNVGGRQVEIDWKLQDRARCIDRLQVLEDGSLWVSNSHARERWESHGEHVYDVFDQAGLRLREVIVTVPDGGPGDRLILLDDGRFLLVKGMEQLAIMVGASSSGATSDMASRAPAGDAMLELICYDAFP